jgi:catechol 2,3-dioxygenase-like lactoylglutathione lyase family enzyme
MALRADMVTIDCSEPRTLAEFWTRALGYAVVADYDGEYLMLRPAAVTDGGFTLGLQRVPEPRVGKNRVHLDLRADDRASEVQRLAGLGAKILDEHGMPGFGWTVLEDPQGNVFCVGAEE